MLKETPAWKVNGKHAEYFIDNPRLQAMLTLQNITDIFTSGTSVVASGVLSEQPKSLIRYIFNPEISSDIKLIELQVCAWNSEPSVELLVWEFSNWSNYAPDLIRPEVLRISKWQEGGECNFTTQGKSLLYAHEYWIQSLRTDNISDALFQYDPPENETLVEITTAGKVKVSSPNQRLIDKKIKRRLNSPFGDISLAQLVMGFLIIGGVAYYIFRKSRNG